MSRKSNAKRSLVVEKLCLRVVFAHPTVSTLLLPDGFDVWKSVPNYSVDSYALVGQVPDGRVLRLEAKLSDLSRGVGSLTTREYHLREGESVIRYIDAFSDGRLYAESNLGTIEWLSPETSVRDFPLGVDETLLDVLAGEARFLTADAQGAFLLHDGNSITELAGVESVGEPAELPGGGILLPVSVAGEPAIVRYLSQADVVIQSLHRPQNVGSQIEYFGQAIGATIVPGSAQELLLAEYFRADTSTFRIGLWDGVTSEFLQDVSTETTLSTELSKGSLLQNSFGDGPQIAFFDAYASLPLADSLSGYATFHTYDLNLLLSNAGYAGSALESASNLTSDDTSLMSFVGGKEVDGQLVQQIFLVSNRPWLNANKFDVTNDSVVSPLDALVIINLLNREGSHTLGVGDSLSYYYDVNGDGYVVPLDVLLVINELNFRSSHGEGEENVSLISSPAMPFDFDSSCFALCIDSLGRRRGFSRQLLA